jgi:hypothetical protein
MLTDGLWVAGTGIMTSPIQRRRGSTNSTLGRSSSRSCSMRWGRRARRCRGCHPLPQCYGVGTVSHHRLPRLRHEINVCFLLYLRCLPLDYTARRFFAYYLLKNTHTVVAIDYTSSTVRYGSPRMQDLHGRAGHGSTATPLLHSGLYVLHPGPGLWLWCWMRGGVYPSTLC